MKRNLLALLTSTAIAVSIAAAANAGEFVLTSCGESPTNESTGWTQTSTTTLDSGLQCPPNVGQPGSSGYARHTGIYLTDRLSSGDTPGGSSITAAFTAAAGTSITRARLWTFGTRTGDPGWGIVGTTAQGTLLETCATQENSGCNFGNPNYAGPHFDSNPGDVTEATGLSTDRIVYRLSCTPPSATVCTNGASLHSASLSIFGTKLTINDPSAPAQQTPTGSLWTASGYQQGSLELSAGAADNTGISTTQLIVDGQQTGQSARSCNYSRPVPCTDEPGAALTLNTAAIADGSHTLTVRALDAAANPSTLARSAQLLTDNTAPASPLNIRADGANPSTTNTWTVRWDLAADAGSPVTRAYYSVCPAGTTTNCTSGQADGQQLTQLPAFALPGPGRWDVRVRLQDELGHSDPASGSSLTLEYLPQNPSQPTTSTPPPTTTVPPPPPTTSTTTTTPPPPPPATKSSAKLTLTRARRSSRAITLSGTTTMLAAGTVRITFSQRIGGRTLRATRSARLSRGRFALTFRLTGSLSRTRTGTLSVAYAGSAKVRSARVQRTLRRT